MNYENKVVMKERPNLILESESGVEVKRQINAHTSRKSRQTPTREKNEMTRDEVSMK